MRKHGTFQCGGRRHSSAQRHVSSRCSIESSGYYTTSFNNLGIRQRYILPSLRKERPPRSSQIQRNHLSRWRTGLCRPIRFDLNVIPLSPAPGKTKPHYNPVCSPIKLIRPGDVCAYLSVLNNSLNLVLIFLLHDILI